MADKEVIIIDYPAERVQALGELGVLREVDPRTVHSGVVRHVEIIVGEYHIMQERRRFLGGVEATFQQSEIIEGAPRTDPSDGGLNELLVSEVARLRDELRKTRQP